MTFDVLNKLYNGNYTFSYNGNKSQYIINFNNNDNEIIKFLAGYQSSYDYVKFFMEVHIN